jgi:hypothetical protein
LKCLKEDFFKKLVSKIIDLLSIGKNSLEH